MNIKKQMEKVRKSLEGKTFDQLEEYFKEWENSGYYNVEIDNIIMDQMEKTDEQRFLKWANEY